MDDLSITSTRKEENSTGKFNTFLTNAAFHQGVPTNKYPVALCKHMLGSEWIKEIWIAKQQ